MKEGAGSDRWQRKVSVSVSDEESWWLAAELVREALLVVGGEGRCWATRW